MLDTLEKVKLAVAKKELIAWQTCFHFYQGRVQAFNGAICVDAPIAFFGDDEIIVDAVKFLKAVKLCGGNFKHTVTKANKLSIAKNKFRALLPLQENNRIRVIEKIKGTKINADGMLKILRRLRPFVSEDASRPWSRAILFRGGFAYATNNVAIARVPAPNMHEISLPVSAIDTLLEIDVEPESVVVTERAVQFNFADDSWFISQLHTEQWPDVQNLIVETEITDLPPYFVGAIENTVPFCDDAKFPIILLGDFGISTAEGISEATIDIGRFKDCKFRAEPLLIVARCAYGIAFDSYPKPCYFEGEDDMCGVIVGLVL